MLLDVVKGFVPGARWRRSSSAQLAGVLAGGAAMLGHWRPLFLALRRRAGRWWRPPAARSSASRRCVGGIGVGGLDRRRSLLFRYASVASIVAALSLPFVAARARRAVAGDRLRGDCRASAVIVLHRAEHRAACARGPRPASGFRRRAQPRQSEPASHSRSSVCLRPAARRRAPRAARPRCRSAPRDVVRVDRLEVHLRAKQEVAVVELRVGRERVAQRDPHRVLDEARLQVGVLDDEELVGPLQQLVDRRAHRALDDRDELLGVERPLGADEERSAAALVVGRERDELEDPLDVELVEARLAEPLGRVLAHEPLRARAGVDPGRLDTDDPPRTPSADAAAIPNSETISCVGGP